MHVISFTKDCLGLEQKDQANLPNQNSPLPKHHFSSVFEFLIFKTIHIDTLCHLAPLVGNKFIFFIVLYDTHSSIVDS